MKIQKKDDWGSGRGGGVQGRCERFCENSKKKWGRGRGGQGKCERRSEVFLKLKNQIRGGGGLGGGVRVDVNGEVKFFENSKIKLGWGGGSGGGGQGGCE